MAGSRAGARAWWQALLLCGLAAGWPAAAAAQEGFTWFRTPSDNIHCMAIAAEGLLRCDVAEAKRSFTKPPADCDLEWGDAFELRQQGPAQLACHGDTVRNPDAAVVAYDTVFEAAGFACRSERAGLTCVNPEGRGFFLSKARQILF